MLFLLGTNLIFKVLCNIICVRHRKWVCVYTKRCVSIIKPHESNVFTTKWHLWGFYDSRIIRSMLHNMSHRLPQHYFKLYDHASLSLTINLLFTYLRFDLFTTGKQTPVNGFSKVVITVWEDIDCTVSKLFRIGGTQ